MLKFKGAGLDLKEEDAGTDSYKISVHQNLTS